MQGPWAQGAPWAAPGAARALGPRAHRAGGQAPKAQLCRVAGGRALGWEQAQHMAAPGQGPGLLLQRERGGGQGPPSPLRPGEGTLQGAPGSSQGWGPAPSTQHTARSCCCRMGGTKQQTGAETRAGSAQTQLCSLLGSWGKTSQEVTAPRPQPCREGSVLPMAPQGARPGAAERGGAGAAARWGQPLDGVPVYRGAASPHRGPGSAPRELSRFAGYRSPPGRAPPSQQA